MKRLLLCTMTAPWPDRPLLGIYHIHQALALAELDVEVQIYHPAPCFPAWLRALSSRARRHSLRPESYLVDGIKIHSPQVRFAFPPWLRSRLTPRAPQLVCRAAERAMAESFGRTILEFAPDAILAHGMIPWAQLVGNTAKRLGKAHGYLEHSADDVMRLRGGTRLAAFYAQRSKQAAASYVVGPQMLRHVQSLGWQHARFIPNGILKSQEPTDRSDRPESRRGQFVILAAANNYPRKGLSLLVTAFTSVADRLPHAQLHIVTELDTNLANAIDQSDARERITVHPPLPQKELLHWLTWADLFVSPAWSEAFGLTPAEALALGTPIVVTTDSGIGEFVAQWNEQGDPSGWVVPAHNTQALAEAILTAIRSPADCARIADRGSARVTREFSWLRNAQVLAQQFFPQHEAWHDHPAS